MSRAKRKKAAPKQRSDSKAKQMVKARLGSESPNSPVPEGYQTWAHYFKTNSVPPQPYKSWLEYRMFEEGCLKGVPYEQGRIEYKTEPKSRKYIPDGTLGDYLLELKGHFRTPAEASKYVDIAKCNPDKTLVFIFAVRDTKMPGAKERKDGTFRTQEEWAEANGFLHTFEDEAKEFVKGLL